MNENRTETIFKTGPKPPRPMLIGEVAELAGVKTDTIRFYEKNGLLPAAERKASGYRVYDKTALKQVRFIKQAQSLGFTLDEVRRILHLREQGKPACACVMKMAEATLVESEEKLKALQTFTDALRKNLTSWRKTPAGKKIAAEFCALIESTDAREKVVN